MIKIEKTEVYGWEAAIRGMRNPMNSWDKSDSRWCSSNIDEIPEYYVGPNDLKLMINLSKAGTDHSKFLRMINVTADVTCSLYWFKEYDTYKVGTVANSCSTMHKLTEKKFELEDFSHDYLLPEALKSLNRTIKDLNYWRDVYFKAKTMDDPKPSAKKIWEQMIQLLPSSYNQKRTVQLNYQVLKNMYHARKNHKLDEWRDFCKWCEELPYFKEICIEV